MAVESRKILQELSYSDNRKKLDGFTVCGIDGAYKDMMDANIGKSDLESSKSKSLYDFRKSFAWDSAFSTSPGFLEPEELHNILKSGHSQNGFDILGHEEHQLLSAKYLEPKIKSVNDEFNLRKSLAWDSAFFTSEGVLNNEELSLVNKGFKKSEIHILLRIEELQVSSESNCTIDSDGTSLASLEVELFEDIRASMPRSRKEKDRNMQKVNSSKTVDGERIPKLKVKSRPTSVRQTINGSQPKRIAKESSTPPLWKFSAGIGASDPSLPLKPPKILGRGRNIPMVPTKGVSLVSNEVSGESKIVRATKGKCLKPNPGKTCHDNPSSTCSSENSCLSHQSSVDESKVLSLPYSQFSTCRSSMKSYAIEKDTPNVKFFASNSTLTSPSECRITNQIEPENCGHSAYSSVKMNYPCISSSVSSDSSFSLSSASTNHVSHDSMTSASESCPKFYIDSDASAQSDLKGQPHGQSIVAHDDKGRMYSTNICTRVKGNNFVSSDASRNIKPSGLRMPTPKIGFFDVDDSLLPIENGAGKPHSGVQNAVFKVGSCRRNLNEKVNRSRPGKIQTARTLKETRSTKIFPQKTRRSLISGTRKSTLGLAKVSKAQSELHWEEKNKDYLRNYGEKVNVTAHELEFELESCAGMKRRGAPESMGNRMIKEKEEQSLLWGKRLLQKERIKAKTVYIGNDPHMLHENEKENFIGFQNKLEGLHEQVKALAVSSDVVIRV